MGSVHRSGSAPLRVLTRKGHTIAVANVTLNGHGPYPFIVDTGASTSVVDTAVARAVGLPTSGKSEEISGVGCSAKAKRATVTSWSVGSVELPKDTVSVLTLGGGGGSATSGNKTSAFGGLLGSDVLSKFGEVALDYGKQRLRLGGAAVRLSTKGARAVNIKVLESKGAVLALAPVKVDGHGPYPFVVDTGAAGSVVDRSVAHDLSLPVLARHGTASGVACTVHTSTVQVHHWHVGHTSLPGTKLMSLSLPGPRHGQGIEGLLGSGTLSRFGTVAIDYAHERLLLAPRVTTPPGGTAALAVHHGSGGTLAVVSLTIDGKGPFPFALDTGASTSVVDRRLAKRLQLPSTGKRENVSGAVSGEKVPVDHVGHWSAGNVQLPPHDVAVLSLPGSGKPGAIRGLLGSDVLRHFGVVTIDYHHDRLSLGKAAHGPSVATKVPLEVVSQSGATVVLVPVTVGGKGPFGFTLDTGATRSVVAERLVTHLGLHPTGRTTSITGIVSATHAPVIALAHWSTGKVSLPPTDAVALRLPGASTRAMSGLLGSDVLGHFGIVTVDYRRGVLLVPGR